MDTNNLTIKQRLAKHGYFVVKVFDENNSYIGMSVVDVNGNKCHEGLTVDVGFGIELLDRLEEKSLK